MVKYVLFDLDGTLTDSQEGIINSILYALKSFGIAVEDRNSLRPFLGPPLLESMKKYYGFDQEQAELALKKYREYFSTTGLLENRVYPGIPQLLEKLKRRGYILMVATSKPELYTLQILEHFDLQKYFSFVGGATMDEKRVHKGDVIRYVLESNRLEDRSEVIMVGDRCNDVQGAKENGIQVIGVLYGYGDREELESAGADFLAKQVEELLRFLP